MAHLAGVGHAAGEGALDAPAPTGPRVPSPGAVTIETLTEAHGTEFVVCVRESRAFHHPWADLPDTPERFAGLVERFAVADQRAYVLRHRSCRRLVGYVSVGNIVRASFQSAYLGYAAFAGHHGRGLMREGLARVVAEAFGPLGLHRLEANIQPDNARSIALVRSLGFRKEGLSPRYLMVDGAWRDHERWAILAEDLSWPTGGA